MCSGFTNDSGGGARAFALATDGTHLGEYALDDADSRDWEDMAVGPGPAAGVDYLYFGDIGDNDRRRSDVRIYRVPEPTVSPAQSPVRETLRRVERLTLKYPDGAHNAESLMVDPITGDLFILVKSSDGVSPVFRMAAPLSDGEMEQVASLPFGTGDLPGFGWITSADISPLGNEIIVRTYIRNFIWVRNGAGTVADAFAGTPCQAPQRNEPQGEAVAYAADGSGYFTISEGSRQPVWWFARR